MTRRKAQGATFETLLALDEKLAKHGVPRLSEWWKDVLARWYRHPTARTLAVCAGRGSAKSDALYKTATNECLFGSFTIPPGERHWASLTSLQKDEAAKGTNIISARLKMLGVRHRLADGVIELLDMPRGIRITAASVGGNTGWRSFFDGSDEVGKWPTEGALAVDAVEVLSSKRAMCATHPSARHMLVSTPFLDSGPFFQLIAAGSDEHTVVGGPAPTWIVAPHVSEAYTRTLERDERRHAREYGAVFSSEWMHGFFTGVIDQCVVEEAGDGWDPVDDATYIMSIDPAFVRDQFAIAIAHHERDGIVQVDRVVVVEPEVKGAKLEPTYALERVRELAIEYGCGAIISDQHEYASLSALAQLIDVYISEETWTAANKQTYFGLVRTLMADKKVKLPNDRALRRELAAIGTRLLPSGHEQITARAGCHDDRVTAMVAAVARASDMAPRVETRGRRKRRPHTRATATAYRDHGHLERGDGRARGPVHEPEPFAVSYVDGFGRTFGGDLGGGSGYGDL